MGQVVSNHIDCLKSITDANKILLTAMEEIFLSSPAPCISNEFAYKMLIKAFDYLENQYEISVNEYFKNITLEKVTSINIHSRVFAKSKQRKVK